ncbi:opioid-binding protein/cell adhesion molecule homolog [Folsomia candida]|uniref:opioid-binding protein/cell adhesion molecule homolog n=1 Tax=Folsomia candida TaxID=158441 RepID=UPI000B9073C4|nr:opioid-binding protein/cell adhesion molecule homolog [Folsomia candida]
MSQTIRFWSIPSTCFFRWILSVPYVLLLLITNQGMLHHVQGRQIRESHNRFDRTNGNHHPTLHQGHHSHGHHSSHGNLHSIHNIANPHQYTSYEEFQRAMENPFDTNTGSNITVPLGDTAFLRCKVRNLGERSISWIRRRDWHILSAGKQIYTSDERFQVLHSDGSDEWTLQVKFVQKRDNGTYECQVSTGTGVASYNVHLVVAVPEAFILGNGEYHVEQGSTINLVCIIEKSPKPPSFVFWYHNERMINFGASQELSIHTEPGTGKTHSRLIIRGAQLKDSGNFTCQPANAESASIQVYVSQASGLFTGDQTAAIQHHNTASSAVPMMVLPWPVLHFVPLIVPFIQEVDRFILQFLH